MQPTPLSGDKIVAILNAGFSSIAFPIYCGGAADGQSVRRRHHSIQQLQRFRAAW
jgi:hypothetical protein